MQKKRGKTSRKAAKPRKGSKTKKKAPRRIARDDGGVTGPPH